MVLFFKKEHAFFCLVCACVSLQGLAASPPATRHQAEIRLKATERDRAATLAAAQNAARQQQQAAAQAATLAQQRAEAAARLRELEDQVGDTAEKLAAASAAGRAAEAEITRRTADLNALLPLALRLSLYPTETILAAPVPPDRALEGLLIAHGVSAELARQVDQLRHRQLEAAELQQTVAQTETRLAAQRARQQTQAASLDKQLGTVQALARAAQDESGAAALQASLLAARAADLRGAIAAMAEAERQAAARAAQEAAQAGRQNGAAARARVTALSRPAGPGLVGAARVSLVAGTVVRAWGAAAEDGPASGITFRTAPAAFVASPCTGRVGFAAPFRSYGKLIILECGGGYDFVLAGLGRLDAAVGTRVRAGEPIGRMPDYDPSKAADRPGLYVELRRGGQPIDPMPYLHGRG